MPEVKVTASTGAFKLALLYLKARSWRGSLCQHLVSRLLQFYGYILNIPDCVPEIRRWPWRWAFTYLQLWVVGIYAIYKVQLCHKVFGQMPGSVDAKCQGILCFSKSPLEGWREVSALMQNNTKWKQWDAIWRQDTQLSCKKLGESKMYR